MFRDDLFTVKRPKSENVHGEVIWGEPEIIAENIPCHLSVKALSPVNQTQSTASVMYDFTLFYDRSQNVSLNKNDIIEVKTGQGDYYELYAGQSHKYALTVQTHLEKNKIV